MYDVEVLFKDDVTYPKHFKCEEVEYLDAATALITGDNVVILPNTSVHHIIAERNE